MVRPKTDHPFTSHKFTHSEAVLQPQPQTISREQPLTEASAEIPTREQRAAERARAILLDEQQGGGPVRDFWPTWRGSELQTPDLPLERVGGAR